MKNEVADRFVVVYYWSKIYIDLLAGEGRHKFGFARGCRRSLHRDSILGNGSNLLNLSALYYKVKIENFIEIIVDLLFRESDNAWPIIRESRRKTRFEHLQRKISRCVCATREPAVGCRASATVIMKLAISVSGFRTRSMTLENLAALRFLENFGRWPLPSFFFFFFIYIILSWKSFQYFL